MSIEKMPVRPTKQDSCENITGGGTYYPDISQIREMCASLLCLVEDAQTLHLVQCILELSYQAHFGVHPDDVVNVAHRALIDLHRDGWRDEVMWP